MTSQPTNPDARCLSCGHIIDRATHHKDSRLKPNPGDISICYYCGTLGVLDKVFNLRKPTKAEIIEMQEDPVLWKQIQDWLDVTVNIIKRKP